jgi:hypothetical protein
MELNAAVSASCYSKNAGDQLQSIYESTDVEALRGYNPLQLYGCFLQLAQLTITAVHWMKKMLRAFRHGAFQIESYLLRL